MVGWNVIVFVYCYRDLEWEIDLIEEVVCLYGYDNFCEILFSKSVAGYLFLGELVVCSIWVVLCGVGLIELMYYFLVK